MLEPLNIFLIIIFVVPLALAVYFFKCFHDLYDIVPRREGEQDEK